MKKITLLATFLWIAVSTLTGQNYLPECAPGDLPASECELACIRCDLNGYIGNNANGGSGQSAVCFQNVSYRANWFGFIAGSTLIRFKVTPSNCTNGDGLEVALLETCNAAPLECVLGGAGMGSMPETIGYAGFVVGKSYYLAIDGYLGDVCDYTIEVIEGLATPPPLATPPIPQGPSLVCPGATIPYSVPSVPGVGYYTWKAPPGASINGVGNQVTLDGPEAATVWISFGNSGGQVCVKTSSICQPETPFVCKSVTVAPIPPTTLPPATILADELPYFWQDGAEMLTQPGVYNLSTFYQSWLGCDSLVRQKVTVLNFGSDYVSGQVYWDINDNGTRDANELPYTGSTVITSSSGVFTNSNLLGQFNFTGQSAGDTIRAQSPLPGVNVTPAFRTVQPGMWTGYDFGLFPVPVLLELSLSVNTTVLRPGFNSWITLVCKNNSNAPANNVVVTFNMPPELVYLSANAAPDAVIGNEYTWNIGTLATGETRVINIAVNTPVNTPLGSTVLLSGLVTPVDDDIVPANNFATLSATVVGSYDPNDKLVEPAYVTPALLANGNPFEYTIRFQNTGTFPAEFVRIIDTLGGMVDPATFQFISSSHPCTWKMRGAGVVEFFFENIQLPDSTSDEAGSHGFVRFAIKPKDGLPLGTVVENFCDIYFDFNAPVRTNTAGTQVVYFLPGQGLISQAALSFKPNPAAIATRAHWKTPAPADGRIRLFDARGLPKLEMPVFAGQTSLMIPLTNLLPGLYFVVLETGSLMLTNKLVVVTLGGLGNNN
jgi:uncharacterized repeat protein (TIGR01451 family)